MSKIVLISSFCDTEEKLNVLSKNISKIKNLGLDVMLNSPISIPSHIINMCDYYIQTKENPVLDLESKIVYSWAIYQGARNGHKDITVYHGTRDYGWANLYQIKKLSEYALTYKYDKFYHIIYDLIIDDVVLKAFDSNDKVCNFYHFHEHWASLHLMVFNKENLLNFISYLTLDKYLEYNGIVEGWIEGLLKSNDIPYYMEDDYVNDEIHYYEGIDLYDYSKIKDFKYFLSKNGDNNIQIYFYELSEIDIDIIVDDNRKSYKVKDRDIIDLGFNKHNIKNVVLDYKGSYYNITDDIKSILHNYIVVT
jgi:hypothetical protein